MIDLKHLLWTLGMALVLLPSSVRGEETRLRYKFKESEVLHYKTVSVMNQEQAGMKVTSEQVQYTDWKVLKVEGEVATLEMKATRVTMKMDHPMMGGSQEYDSDKDKEAGNSSLGIQGFLVGKVYTVKMDTRGQVLAVKGFTEIGKEVMKKMEATAGSDPNFAQQRQAFESMFTDETRRKSMEHEIPTLPEKPVALGAKWEEEIVVALPMFFDLLAEQSMVLESEEGGVAKIRLTGTLTKKEKGKDEPTDPMTEQINQMMKFEGGKMSGDLLFDVAAGRIMKSNTKQELKLKFEMFGQTQEMPMVMDYTLELVPEPAKMEKAEEEK